MRYQPNRGGHAPGYLRDAISDWLDSGGTDNTVAVGDDQVKKPIRWVIGQLWNCTDIMGSSLCDDIEVPPGSTYARGVRKLAGELP